MSPFMQSQRLRHGFAAMFLATCITLGQGRRLGWVALLTGILGLNACVGLGQALTEGRPLFVRADADQTPLHRAVRDHHTSQVAQLLAAGADPNVHDNEGVTPLYQAVRQGAADMVALLLAAGADPNVHDTQGFTPLYHTAGGESTETRDIMVQLLAAGADPNAATPHGTPLYGAASYRNLEGLRMLLAAEADPNARAGNLGAPLDAAAVTSFLAGARMLLAAGADPNAHTGYGSPLHTAIRSDAGRDIVGEPSQAWRMVEVLLAAGADPNVRIDTLVDSGMTPLPMDIDTLVLLGSGITPLHEAAHYADPWVAEVLLVAGADPQVRMDSGETPLQIAQLRYAHYSSPGGAHTSLHAAKRHNSAALIELLRHHGGDE